MTDEDRAILELAAAHYINAGARERDAREQLGLTGTQLWQRANRLLDDPEAAIEMPQVVARLRRLREGRQVQRRRTTP